MKRKEKSKTDSIPEETETKTLNTNEDNGYMQADMLKVIAKIAERCESEKIFYFDVFKDHAPKGINLLNQAQLEKSMTEIMGEKPLGSRDYQIINQFFCKKSVNSKKILVDYPEICKELDLMKRVMKYKEPMFNNIKENLLRRGITLETYLKNFKSAKSGNITTDNLLKIMKDTEILIENGSDLRMMLVLTEARSVKRIKVDDFKSIYVEITGDKESEEEEEDDKGLMSLREKHWAHLHFLEFSKNLRKFNFENLEKMATEDFGKGTVDERGYCSLDNLNTMLRKLDPGINVDDLKKLSGELKGKTSGKYSVKKLDRMIVLAGKIENKSRQNLTASNINHRNNQEIKDMLKTFTKHCLRSKSKPPLNKI